jgi:hypothetical protein
MTNTALALNLFATLAVPFSAVVDALALNSLKSHKLTPLCAPTSAYKLQKLCTKEVPSNATPQD